MPGFKRFLADRSGAISIVSALSIFMLLAIAVIVIDVGHLYFMRRELQSTTDAAALAAVQNPSNAYAVAMDVFTRNGYGDETLTVTTGAYSADESLSVGARFTPTLDHPDAVRVHATRNQTNYLAAIFGGAHSALATEATAARVPTISFGAGTRLASLDAGVINSLLNTMLGSSLSLQAIDYKSLVNTNIDALTFLNTLATNVSVTGSYQQLANANVSIAQLLTAAAQTAQATNGATGEVAQAQFALQALQSGIPGAQTIKLSDLIDITPLYGRTIGNITADATSLQLNLFSLLSASARTVSQNQLINLGTSLTIPVTNSSVTTKVAIGAPFTQISNGGVDSSVQTAQVRIALTTTVTNISLAGLATATIQLPLYVEGAYGKATVTELPCTVNGTLAKIDASSGAVSLKFGTVTDTALKNFSTPVTPATSPIVNVSLLTMPIQVNASGSVDLLATSSTPLTFSQDEITAGTIKSVPDSVTSPFTTLSNGLTLSASIIGTPSNLIVSLLNSQITTVLGVLKPVVSNLITQLNAPVTSILASLGITLGTIDVRVFDESCRTPVLVE